MAIDQKISELSPITAANVDDADELAIVDDSAVETKKILMSELFKLFDFSAAVRVPRPMIIWRLIANSADGNVDPVGPGGSDWEISDDSILENQLGSTQVTESSGIFSFLSTGLWSVRGFATGGVDSGDGDDRNTQVRINGTDDNGVGWTPLAGSQTAIIDVVATASTSNYACETLVRITDLANDKIKLTWSAITANPYLLGSTTRNITYLVFEKKADL